MTDVRLAVLALLVVLAGCVGGGPTPTPEERTVVRTEIVEKTVVVERTVTVVQPSPTPAVRTVVVNRTVTVEVTPTPTPTPTPTATPEPTPTPTPDYSELLDAGGTVSENSTHWIVEWSVTNEADRAVRYDFDLIVHYTDDSGRTAIANLANVEREFAEGETWTKTRTYSKNESAHVWGDEGPRGPDVEYNDHEVLDDG